MQAFHSPSLHVLLVLETVKHIPHILHHPLFRLFPSKSIDLSNGVLVVIAEQAYQGSDGRTTADRLCHTVVELIWLFSCILDILIFILSGEGLSNVLKVKRRLALSEELRLYLIKLF